MSAILGGGLSGLSAGFYALNKLKLNNKQLELAIIESSDRIGGWIKSNKRKSGVIFESGPRTVRPGLLPGKNTLKLVDDLNLTDKIIPIKDNHPSAKNRMIYANGQLHTLPNSFGSLFTIKSPFRRPLVTMFWNDFRAKKVVKDDESLYSFVERRMGKDVADYLISPLICGICAGDAKQISVKFLMKLLFEGEQKYGSIRKAVTKGKIFTNDINYKKLNEDEKTPSIRRSESEKWSVWGLEGGLELLPKTLSTYLINNNVNINLNNNCDKITFESDCVKVEVNGKTFEYSSVISSLPAQNLGNLVKHQHNELANELLAIPSVDVVVINLEYPKNVLEHDAFGFLVPPKEKLPILGVIFDSCVFPQKSSTVLTVMMGGAWYQHYFGNNPTEEYLLSVARQQLKNTLNINVDPLDYNISILKNCISQYIVGHNERINRIRKYISDNKLRLAVCGSSYDGVGINDVILSAKNAVEKIIQ